MYQGEVGTIQVMVKVMIVIVYLWRGKLSLIYDVLGG
jgi:hypothetical protein